MPDIHQHDTFIAMIGQMKGKFFVLHESTAAHRWTGDNNVSNTGVSEPFWIKVCARLKIYSIAIWRCMTIKQPL